MITKIIQVNAVNIFIKAAIYISLNTKWTDFI